MTDVSPYNGMRIFQLAASLRLEERGFALPGPPTELALLPVT
jgi:hypothetical protein